MRIIVGTKNIKKIAVVKSVFENFYAENTVIVAGHDADSKMPEAPLDQQTYDGALNRAEACFALGSADYYVGLESGLVERYGHTFEEAWAVIIASSSKKHIGYSSGLMIPNVVVDRMQKGELHNNIMAEFDKLFDLPDDNRDTWSRYTGGSISRIVSLEESLRNALIQNSPSKRNLYTMDKS